MSCIWARDPSALGIPKSGPRSWAGLGTEVAEPAGEVPGEEAASQEGEGPVEENEALEGCTTTAVEVMEVKTAGLMVLGWLEPAGSKAVKQLTSIGWRSKSRTFQTDQGVFRLSTLSRRAGWPRPMFVSFESEPELGCG